MNIMVAGMVLVFFLLGCASKGVDQGRVVAQSGKGERVTIQQLTEDFTKYDVYYSGIKPTRAVSVLFCPKGGDTTLTPDRWWKDVGDQASLTNIVSWMQDRMALSNIFPLKHAENTESRPSVLSILGPGSQLFGYTYSYSMQITTRVASETELIIYAPVN